MKPKYNRVLIKISGEALAGEDKVGINEEVLNKVASEIKEVQKLGVEIGIVVGGGNFWRGKTSKSMDRATADYMGMLATVINSLALKDALESKGLKTRVHTAIEMRAVAEPYIRLRAMKQLSNKEVVIFGAGTGSPFFSTDTTAALRAAEIEADVILLAKNVDAVYEEDPLKNPKAKKYDRITFQEILENHLEVIDSTAASLCMDNNIPVHIFAIGEQGNIVKAVLGKTIGTLIT